MPTVRDWIGSANHIAVLTGAGMSAESGVPTFRDAQTGLWARFKPEDLATEDAFRAHPRRVWDWYQFRRDMIAQVEPNAGHRALAAFQQRHPGRLTLITQNVDGLHELAGTRDVIRFHGSIWELRCAGACGAAPWDDRRAPLPSLPPHCPSCGGLARPGVVWFGEAIDRRILTRCEAALSCDVFLSVGTSSVVYPAAGLAHAARDYGAFTVEINPTATDAAAALDLAIAASAEHVLPLLRCGTLEP